MNRLAVCAVLLGATVLTAGQKKEETETLVQRDYQQGAVQLVTQSGKGSFTALISTDVPEADQVSMKTFYYARANSKDKDDSLLIAFCMMPLKDIDVSLPGKPKRTIHQAVCPTVNAPMDKIKQVSILLFSKIDEQNFEFKKQP